MFPKQIAITSQCFHQSGHKIICTSASHFKVGLPWTKVTEQPVAGPKHAGGAGFFLFFFPFPRRPLSRLCPLRVGGDNTRSLQQVPLTERQPHDVSESLRRRANLRHTIRPGFSHRPQLLYILLWRLSCRRLSDKLTAGCEVRGS